MICLKMIGHPAFTDNYFDYQQSYNAQFKQTRFPGPGNI